MRASRGITDVASTINSVWFQSNLTHRGQIIGTRPFNLPSHRTHYTSIMAAAMHHLHLDTLLSLLSHTGGQAHWATTEVCLSSVCGNESDPPMGRGEMRPCIQYTGEIVRLLDAFHPYVTGGFTRWARQRKPSCDW